jgi:hypothetical protein
MSRYVPYLLEVNRNPAVGKNWTMHGREKTALLLDSLRMMAGTLWMVYGVGRCDEDGVWCWKVR